MTPAQKVAKARREADRCKTRSDEWRQKAIAATVAAVEACPHPPEQIILGEARLGTWISQAEFLVCRQCGYAEEGFYCGTWRLNQTYGEPKMDHYEAQKLVHIFVSQDDMEKLGRYGQHRADPNFSLRDCVRKL